MIEIIGAIFDVLVAATTASTIVIIGYLGIAKLWELIRKKRLGK